jgi:F-type H+-transporting ATPase subunit a
MAKFLAAAVWASILVFAAGSSEAFAGGGIVDWYPLALGAVGLDAHHSHVYSPVASSLLVTVMLLSAGFLFSSNLKKSGEDVLPSRSFGLRVMIEAILDFIYGIAKDNCGHEYRRFLPLLCTLFLFILTCNLSGLVPGFTPATVDISTNLAMGLIVFFTYNFAGFREHGVGYLKQFAGPVVAIAPLFVFIELVSHLSRPFSLSLRLAGNIFADHLILSVFTGLTYVIAPSLLMFFGLIVAGMQSFVFTLLTSIYVSMAISHDH